MPFVSFTARALNEVILHYGNATLILKKAGCDKAQRVV